MIAFSRAIFCVPKESTMVTMEESASGMAATARATAKRKAFMRFSCRRNTLTQKSTAQITRIPMESFFPN